MKPPSLHCMNDPQTEGHMPSYDYSDLRFLCARCIWSNHHCEQFDHPESNHQHRDRYGIVIEPMPLLCIHDTPPYSSNFDVIRTHGPHRCGSLLLPFELLDERSDLRGDGNRESIVLDPEVVPN